MSRKHLFDLLFIFLIIVVVVVCFSPLLFFGKAFFDEEQIGFYYPQSFFYQKELKSGSDLVWNNAYYAGVPVGFDQFVSSYYPLHQFLFRWFNFFDAHHLSIVMAVIAGYLFAYWFGRASGFNQVSSFVLSLAYFSATSFGWLDIGTLAAHAFLVLPALLLSLLKISRGERPLLFMLLGGLLLGVGFLAGFMQIIFYIYLIVSLYALFLTWQNWRESRGWRRFKIILGFLLITFMAVVIGGRQILPSVFLIDLTIRTPAYAFQHAETPSLFEFITIVLPDYIKIPFLGGGSDGFYVGALGLLAAVYGIFFSRTKTSLFFLGVYGLVLGFAFHLPIFSWINEHLPPFSRMGGNFRWMLAGAFPLAYLAASGFEGLLGRNANPGKARLFLRVLGWIIISVILLIIFANLFLYYFASRPDLQQKFLEWYLRARSKSLPLENYLPILAQAVKTAKANFSLVDWRMVLPLFWLALAYLLSRNFLAGKISSRFFQGFAIMLVTLNVFSVYVAQYKEEFVPRSVYTVEPLLSREIKSREQNPNNYRLAGFQIGDVLFWKLLSKTMLPPEELASIQRELMVNNVNVFQGIQRIDGMEPYRTLRSNQLLNTVIFPGGFKIFDTSSPALKTTKMDKVDNNEVLKQVTLEDKVKDFLKHLPLLSMLNVKYIYSLIPLADPRLVKIEMPLNPALPLPLYLYENKTVMPRIYFAQNPVFFSGRDIDLLVKMASTKDFTKETFMECQNCAPTETAGKKTVIIKKYQNGWLELETATEKGGWLVFGESFMPGWTATIDGRSTEIYQTNYILQSIYVPAGEHRVEFKYIDIMQLKWQQLKQKIKI